AERRDSLADPCDHEPAPLEESERGARPGAMPWALGIWAFSAGGAGLLVLVTLGSFRSGACGGPACRAGQRPVYGPADGFSWEVSGRCGRFRWSGGLVGDGDDGPGDAGGGVRAAGVPEGAGAFRLAGAVPVPVDDRAQFAECAGQ